MNRRNLTKKFIEALRPAPRAVGRAYYYDAQVRTLQVAVNPGGRQSFVWYKKVRGSGAVRLNIGPFPQWTLEQARERARQWDALAVRGENPAAERRASRQAAGLGEFFEEFLERHGKVYNAERSWRGAQKMFDAHLDRWKNRKLASISHSDVQRLHTDVGRAHGHYTANRLVALLSVMFNKAVQWGHLPDTAKNPAQGIEKFTETPRQRYLTEEESARLGRAMRAAVRPGGINRREAQALVDWVALLVFTGQRESVVRRMRWDAITLDPTHPRHKDDTSTWEVPVLKHGLPQRLPLSCEAVDILLRRGRNAQPDDVFVFPGRRPGQPVTTFKTGWKKLLESAAIRDLRPHDLRRTQATWQGTAGVPLQITTKALGNKTLALAASVYAQADDAAKRDAFARTNRRLLAAMKGSAKKKAKA